MQDKYQILKRQLSTEEYDEVKRGAKAFDVLLKVPGQELDVGDLLTLQETDAEGNLTGKEVTKKISSQVNVEEIKVPDYVDLDKALKNGVSIVGWVAPEQYTLKSVYDFAFTMHLAIDRVEDDDVVEETEDELGSNFNIIEGPFYSPPLASPEFLQYGVLKGFKIEKWPIGRYSIVLMLHVNIPEDESPLEVDAVDALVMTVEKENDIESTDPPLKFHELDVRALIDGNVVTLDSKTIVPATPREIEEIIQAQFEKETEEEETPIMSANANMDSMATALQEAKDSGELGDLSEDDLQGLLEEMETISKDSVAAAVQQAKDSGDLSNLSVDGMKDLVEEIMEDQQTGVED